MYAFMDRAFGGVATLLSNLKSQQFCPIYSLKALIIFTLTQDANK